MTAVGSILKGEAKDAIVFTGSSMLYQVGSLVLLPLYWSRLSPSDFGIIAVIAVIGAFQALFSSLSLDLAITRFYYEWPEAVRRRNLGAIWTWNWIITIVVGGAVGAATRRIALPQAHRPDRIATSSPRS